MNTDQKSFQLTTDLQTSSALATKLAKAIQTPQLIELAGDLGGGKTTFVKALGKALGVKETITSPTFNITRGYDFNNNGRLEHYDLYRLSDDEIVRAQLQENLADPNSIVVVEWAGNFSQSLSDERLIIKFEYVNDQSRKLTFSATGAKSQKLVEALQ